MSSIDERILSMKMDERDLARGCTSAANNLSKLDDALKLKNGTSGFDDIDKASKRLTFSGLLDGVKSLVSEFGNLGVIGVTVLSNLANRAVDAGVSIAKSLTLDPIMGGFREYETQMGAIQTILANTQSKGSTLKDVNSALDELNQYSDKTIYNFTEMAKNIGTFTAAGVDLKTSTSAIKGIANLAALSGSTSEQASSAMYQLSQALASGTVKLIDWNSVVNAGMGGEVFQKALIETAKVHGTNVDEMIKKEGSFRDTLQKGWLTSAIMTETLSKFTGDLSQKQLEEMGYSKQQAEEILKLGTTASDAATKVKTASQMMSTLREANESGWAQTFKILFGDFEEAKSLFTTVSDVLTGAIGKSADARNSLLQGWKDLGGRGEIIKGLTNLFHGLVSVMAPIGKAWNEVFPPITAKRLYEITVSLVKLTEGFKIGATTSDEIRRSFKGLFAIFDIGVQFVTRFAQALFGFTSKSASIGKSFLGLTANLGDFLVRIDQAVKTGDLFGKIFNGIGNGVEFAQRQFLNFKKFLSEFFSSFGAIDTSGVDALVRNFDKRFAPLGALGDFFGKAADKIIHAGAKLAPAIIKIGTAIADGVSWISKKLYDLASGADFSSIFDGLNVGLLAMLALSIKKFIDSLTGSVDGGTSLLKSIKGIFSGVTDSLSALQSSLKAKTLMSIAIAIALMSASLVALSMVDSKKLAASLGAMTTMLTELFASMSIFGKISGAKSFSNMASVVSSMILLGIAMDVLSNSVIKLSSLSWEGLIKGLSGVSIMLGMLIVTSKTLSTDSAGMLKTAASMVVFSEALKILSGVVTDLSNLSLGNLAKGLGSLGIMMAEIVGFMALADPSKMNVQNGTGFVLIAASIKIMASALQDLGGLSWSQILKGLTSMTAVLAELALFTIVTSGSSGMLGTSVGMIALAAAMKILASALQDFGGMSWGNIAKGLVALGGSLAILVVGVSLMSGAIVGAAAMAVVSVSLLALAAALTTMGNMSWGGIAKALVVLAGSLVILAVAVTAISASVVGAAALLVIAGALAILAPILVSLGNMSWGDIGKSLVMLAGSLTVLGLAGAALTPVIPTLMGLGVAIALIGVGVAAAGLGIMAMGTGLAALAVSGTAAAVALVAIVTALANLIPMIATKIGEGIIAAAAAISNGGTALTNAFTTVIGSLIDSLITLIPKFYNLFVLIIHTMCEATQNTAPELVNTGVFVIRLLLAAIVALSSDFTNAGMSIIINVLTGIRNRIGEVITLGADIVIEFINGISRNFGRIVDAGWNMVINLINSVTNSINAHSGELRSAGWNLGMAIIDGMTGGILSKARSAAATAANAAWSAFQAAKEALDVHSPSKKFMYLGAMLAVGLAVGITNSMGVPVRSATAMATNLYSAVESSLSGLDGLADRNFGEISPTITPVVDLTNIKNSAGQIQNLLSAKTPVSPYQVGAAYDQTRMQQLQLEPVKPPAQNITNIEYHQTNTSPKPLDNLEIYRNTKHMLAMAKEAANYD